MNIKLFNTPIDIKLIVSPIITIIIGVIIYRVLKKIIRKLLQRGKDKKIKNAQRVETLISLVLNIIKYLIVAIVAITILGTLGVNVTSIIAGLGVTTAIIGLAFQDLAKDIIAGFSNMAVLQELLYS